MRRFKSKLCMCCVCGMAKDFAMPHTQLKDEFVAECCAILFLPPVKELA